MHSMWLSRQCCAGQTAIHGKFADQRIEVTPHQDALFTISVVQGITTAAKLLLVYQYRAVGVVPLQACRRLQQADALHAFQTLAITFENRAALAQRTVDMTQLQQAKCGLHLIHLAIDARRHDGGFIRETEVFQVVDALLDLGIRANDGAPFEGIEDLGGMEAQD
ncbi:hypothetical protein D3C80_1622120 [compost metagenome]